MKTPGELGEMETSARRAGAADYKWDIGDEVRLKSGGPPMTVAGRQRRLSGAAYEVKWTEWGFSFDPSRIRTDWFDQRMLVTYPEDAPPLQCETCKSQVEP